MATTRARSRKIAPRRATKPAAPRRPAFARHGEQFHAAAPRSSHGWRQRTGSLGAASGNTRRHAESEPKSAALPAVLGARRRRYVMLRGRAGV